MQTKIGIIGGGDLGKQIAHYITTDGSGPVVGFFDDTKKKGELIGGIPVLGNISDVETAFNRGKLDAILLGIGYKHLEFKKKIYLSFKKRIPFATYIHSSVYEDPTVIVHSGSVVFPGCILDKGVIVQENTLLNIGCTIAHDTIVGPHSFLSPRVAIAGFAKLVKNVS